jgi:hypothetical protein
VVGLDLTLNPVSPPVEIRRESDLSQTLIGRAMTEVNERSPKEIDFRRILDSEHDVNEIFDPSPAHMMHRCDLAQAAPEFDPSDRVIVQERFANGKESEFGEADSAPEV